MVKFEDEVCTPNEPIALLARSLNTSRERSSYDRTNGSTKNREYDAYPSEQGRSSETSLYSHASGYSEPTC